jgi:polyvinyl alcohol dehydrogenase (cytochrome)
VVVRTHRFSSPILACAVMLAACGAQPSTPSSAPQGVAPATAPAIAGTLGSVTAGTPAAASGGASAPLTTGAAPARPHGDVPCEVATLLEAQCVMCHGTRPRLGAPIALMDATSFQKLGMSGLPLQQVVAERVQSQARPMPPQGLRPATELSPLLTWLAAGAAADPQGCAVIDPADSQPTGTTGPAVTAGAAGATAGAAGQGASVGPEAGGNWTMFGGDLGNTRANLSETKLTAQNVSGLKELWSFRGAACTATPAVYEGVVYVPTWGGKVHALDAATGMQRWMTALPDLIDSSPTVTATTVYVSDDQGSVHALARADGTKLWSKLVDMHAEAHLWSSPIYVPSADLIVLGVASGEEAVQAPFSFRGSVVALDAKTGEERWKFYTTAADATSGPGAAVWATVVVDETRKLVFVGTGNAYDGVSGPLVDSMLALDLGTGMRMWSRQFTANDVFSIASLSTGASGPDFDIGASANLFQAGGKDIIGVGIKSGDYVAMSRDTGEVLWMTNLTPGSVQGGFIASAAVAADKVFAAGNHYPQMSTTLAAFEAVSGKILWKKDLMGGTAFASVAYANGVAYLGLSNGDFYAFDAVSGNQLVKLAAPDAIAGGPSVANGVVYVPWGYNWTLREGMEGNGGLTAYGLK